MNNNEPKRWQAAIGLLCWLASVVLAWVSGVENLAILLLFVAGVLLLFPTRPVTVKNRILGTFGVDVLQPDSDGYQYEECLVEVVGLRTNDTQQIWLEVRNTGVRDEFCCKIVEFADRNEPTLPWVLKWDSWAEETRPLPTGESKKLLVGKLGEDPGTPGLRREGAAGEGIEVRHGRMTFYPHGKNDQHIYVNAYRHRRDEVRARVEISSKKAREPYAFSFRARLKSIEDPQPSVSITSDLGKRPG